MSEPRSRRTTGLATVLSIGLLIAIAGPVAAVEPAFTADFGAGWACADFDLRIEGYGDGQQVWERSLPGGRVISAGTGSRLVYTNLQTGSTMSTRANGAVSITTFYDDGTSRMALKGHNVLILFPADGGPSTTLYVGRVVVDVAADGVWTVRPGAGTATDICAALS